MALEQGTLSIRRASALLEHCPVGSSTWAAFASEDPTNGAVVPGWSNEAHLLAEVWSALVGKPHPAFEDLVAEKKAADPLRREAVRGWKARRDQRERELEQGGEP